MSALINPDESEETDTIAFDHIGLPDGRYILMSSIDSASGHFCEMFEAFICHQHDLQPTARAMRTTAREWFAAHNLSDIADTSTTWIMNLLAYANMRPWHVMQIQEGAHDWRPGSHV
jgi:hypothetical protein